MLALLDQVSEFRFQLLFRLKLVLYLGPIPIQLVEQCGEGATHTPTIHLVALVQQSFQIDMIMSLGLVDALPILS